MLPGAISFQSKANKLLQSTTQVLINIHAFAFKSGPIYSSFPSICETRLPFAQRDRCLQTRGRLRQILQAVFRLDVWTSDARVSRGVSRATGRGCARVNIELVLVVSANSPIIHVAALFPTS